jgi:hypothetical protein
MIDFEDLDPLAESDGMSIGADPADGLIEAAEESICANAY